MGQAPVAEARSSLYLARFHAYRGCRPSTQIHDCRVSRAWLGLLFRGELVCESSELHAAHVDRECVAIPNKLNSCFLNHCATRAPFGGTVEFMTSIGVVKAQVCG
jgi:hypothetical protein